MGILLLASSHDYEILHAVNEDEHLSHFQSKNIINVLTCESWMTILKNWENMKSIWRCKFLYNDKYIDSLIQTMFLLIVMDHLPQELTTLPCRMKMVTNV